MSRHRRKRMLLALEQLAARGPDLQPLTLEQAIEHPIWGLLLHQLLGGKV